MNFHEGKMIMCESSYLGNSRLLILIELLLKVCVIFYMNCPNIQPKNLGIDFN